MGLHLAVLDTVGEDLECSRPWFPGAAIAKFAIANWWLNMEICWNSPVVHWVKELALSLQLLGLLLWLRFDP